MKRFITLGVSFLVVTVLVTSCTSHNFLKAIKTDCTSVEKKITADRQKKITADRQQIFNLRQQLAAAKDKEVLLGKQIENLKTEINEKETLISIQGKVIGLLDDADKTLQKSIEAQFQNRGNK